MGFKKFFKTPKEDKEMENLENSKEYLRKNGVILGDGPNRNKFKFNEFNKYTKEKSDQLANNPLKPRLPGQQGQDSRSGSASASDVTDPYNSQPGTYSSDPYGGSSSTGSYSRFGGQRAPGSQRGGATGQQSKAYDPYAPGNDPYAQQSSNGGGRSQTQLTKQKTTQQSDLQSQDIDLNDYPGNQQHQQQEYDPYAQTETYQAQEEELDSEEEEINRIVRQTKDHNVRRCMPLNII
ncbi:unnamed protein product [Ambrosiozyma monospora]|uniref:Unnamed protein product n=1 Tax=Ambrosiozyma monospora TaxID=43982 RepID=A0ACB5T6Y9_AMBMO|nr:unnamed protein product [Ambrosiozyma monospora]